MSIDGESAFSSAAALVTLNEACAVLGLDPAGAELLRFGQNAIYRLGGQPYVVRIARTSSPGDVQVEVRVARWLARESFPATRVADLGGVVQPVEVGGREVTVWDFVQQAPQRPSISDLGRILRGLHQLAPSPGLALPRFNPFRNLGGRLARARSSVDDRDLAFLRQRADDLTAAFAGLSFELPFGPIHGDAHPGNLMRRQDGSVVIGDLECFATGPREWDLALPAAYRFGLGWITDEEYRAFVDAYGYDVAEAPSFPTLRAIREINMTAWLMQNIDEDDGIRAEFQARIADLRDPSAPRRWQPF